MPDKRFFPDLDKPVTSICSAEFFSAAPEEPLSEALQLMAANSCRKLLVTKKKKLSGVVSVIDILSCLGGGNKHSRFKKYRRSLGIRIGRIMEDPYSVSSRTSLRKALSALRDLNIGSLPVIDKNRNIVGIISDWSMIRRIRGRIGIKASEIMTRKPLIARKDFTVFETAKMMCRGAYKNFPVVEKGILTGLITPMSIINYLSRESKLRELPETKTKIGEIMETGTSMVSPGDDLSEVIDKMKPGGGRPVFVTEDKELAGIITKRDILDVIV